MFHTEQVSNRAEHSELHPADIQFRIGYLFETTHAMSPCRNSWKANVQPGAHHRFEILPKRRPVAGKNKRITLNSGKAFTGMLHSTHFVVFLKLKKRCFGIDYWKQVVQFCYFFPLWTGFVNQFIANPTKCTSFIGFDKFTAYIGKRFEAIIPPPIDRFLIEEVREVAQLVVFGISEPFFFGNIKVIF